MGLGAVQSVGEMVVIRFHDLVDHRRGQDDPVEQVAGMGHVDHPDAGHGRSAVDQPEAFADMHLDGLQSLFGEYFCRGAPGSFVRNFTFADEDERQVGELDEVAAGAYAAVLGDVWENVPVDQLHDQLHHIGMQTRTGLHQGAEPGQHGGFDIDVFQRLAASGGVAPDQVVLQFKFPVAVDLVLGHRSQAGVDPVNDLPFGEFFQKFVVVAHPSQGSCIDLDLHSLEEDLVEVSDRQFPVPNAYHRILIVIYVKKIGFNLLIGAKV